MTSTVCGTQVGAPNTTYSHIFYLAWRVNLEVCLRSTSVLPCYYFLICFKAFQTTSNIVLTVFILRPAALQEYQRASVRATVRGLLGFLCFVPFLDCVAFAARQREHRSIEYAVASSRHVLRGTSL